MSEDKKLRRADAYQDLTQLLNNLKIDKKNPSSDIYANRKILGIFTERTINEGGIKRNFDDKNDENISTQILKKRKTYEIENKDQKGF